MSLAYKTCQHLVQVHQQHVVFGKQLIKIRPKTFSLLLKFLENPYQVLTKHELLTTIWDDVEVQEQVLFQTIAELRQIFTGFQVIKTHPRKGYAWVMDVEIVEDNIVNKAAIASNRWFWQVSLASIFILTLLIGTYLYQHNPAPIHNQSVHEVEEKLSGSLVILPVINRIDDGGHHWVKLGAMDQLITRISSDENLVVMSTDYVLEILRDANLEYRDLQQDLSRIFEVSGASLIVQTQLSGSVQQYQLKYSFHFKNFYKRGVILSSNINEALIELTEKIVSYTGQSIRISANDFKSDFNNEMLVSALDLQEENHHLAAVELFEGLLQVEADNIVARRLLVTSLLELHQLDQAEQQLLIAKQLGQQSNSAELPKIHYLLSLIHYMRGELALAKETLKTADESSSAHQDWLNRALIAQLQGKVDIRYGDYQQALHSLEAALDYHSVIQCPIGTSNTLLALSELASLQGKTTKSQQYYHRASQIIAQRNLTFMQPLLDEKSIKLHK